MENWQTLSNPNLQLTLRYPDPTPQGADTVRREMATDTSYRVHLASEGTQEVYFEVGRYDTLSTERAIEQFIQDVSERIAGLEKSPVVETSLAGFPAWQVNIQWPGKERVIHFVEKDGKLYRVIYDPASPINLQILSTLAFL